MTSLVLYETARRALAEVHRVDEVKDLHDKAEAMRVYAQQAKDSELIDYATEIKIRAERRGGELLREMADRGERAVRGQAQKSHGETFQPPHLADLGVTKTQSSRWQKLAALDDAAFEARLAAAKKAVVASAEMTVAERTQAKKEQRDAREAELGAKQIALPKKKFGVVYADPPWRFQAFSCNTTSLAAENHYPTCDLETIKAFDIASIAADDCVLFLWATVPMLPQALEVMKAWAFDYKTHFIWAKNRPGTGYWNRNKHEVLLLGTKGDVPAPAPGTQSVSLIEAIVGAHSQKPEAFYQLIESYFPNLPKIELFARIDRQGWDAWGLEAPVSDARKRPCEGESTTSEVGDQKTRPAVTRPPAAMPVTTTR
jgi:N6-adenosine-specific RNA methylase IME4